jgi:rod shape-determining protein MreD
VREVKLFFILFVLFLLQGTVMQVFSPAWFGWHFSAIPHFVLIAILLIGLFYDRTRAVWYGLTFGFLIDVVYTNVLGVYAFCIALTGYLFSLLSRIFHLYLVVVVLIGILAVACLEFEVYGIYGLIGKAPEPLDHFLQWRLVPTLVLNGAFLILIFYPFRRMLVSMRSHKIDG